MKSHGALRGFTLVEMVVALALMSLIAVALFGSVRFAQRTYGKIERADADIEELTSSQRLLRRLLESAYPYQTDPAVVGAARSVEGRKNELAFSAPLGQSNGDAGLARYSIVARPNASASTFDLVTRWWLDRNGLPTASATSIREEILLSNVESVEWAYLQRPESGIGGLSGRNNVWLDEWLEHDTLPAAIRLRIKYSSRDARSWPDLIVAPRITDDANCEFDVVAQNCRKVF